MYIGTHATRHDDMHACIVYTFPPATGHQADLQYRALYGTALTDLATFFPSTMKYDTIVE